MVNIGWIRKTFAPPAIATVIAISLISDWGSREAHGNVKVEDTSTASQSSYMKTDSHLQAEPIMINGPVNTSMVLLVYRLPLFAAQHDLYSQSFFRRPEMNAGRSARTWWM